MNNMDRWHLPAHNAIDGNFNSACYIGDDPSIDVNWLSCAWRKIRLVAVHNRRGQWAFLLGTFDVAWYLFWRHQLDKRNSLRLRNIRQLTRAEPVHTVVRRQRKAVRDPAAEESDIFAK